MEGNGTSGVWGVLRWVLLVLATGFVGYVGRFGAQWLIERARARRSLPADAPPGPRQENSAAVHADARAKAEKKRLKALAKAEKKRARTQEK